MLSGTSWDFGGCPLQGQELGDPRDSLPAQDVL